MNAEKKEMTFMDEVIQTVDLDDEALNLLDQGEDAEVHAWTLDGEEVTPDGSNE